jgi:hypothetical protein
MITMLMTRLTMAMFRKSLVFEAGTRVVKCEHGNEERKIK